MSSETLPRVGFALLGGPVNHWTLNTFIHALLEQLDGKAKLIALSGGFQPLLNRCTSGVINLTKEMFADPDKMPGSLLVTERELPRRDNFEWDRAMMILTTQLRLDSIIASGGDGSFITMNNLYEANRGRLRRIVIAPRTMDGDFIKAEFDLGFASALSNAAETIRGFDGDCSLYGMPAVTKIMGRDTGIFTLHCAKKTGARMCLIPEEFQAGVEVDDLIDALCAHVIVVLEDSKAFSQILVAEGFWRALTPESQDRLGMLRLGANQHNRIDYKNSPPINERLAAAMNSRFAELGVSRLGSVIQTNVRQVGHTERQGRQCEEDRALAISQGKWAGELVMAENGDIPQAVIALPNRGRKPFHEVVLTDGGNRLDQPLKLVGPKLWKDVVALQQCLLPADLEGERLARLASHTELSPEEFKNRFARAATFFKHRKP